MLSFTSLYTKIKSNAAKYRLSITVGQVKDLIRGMYFTCWHKGDWNYHPSLMLKRLQQIEDAAASNVNTLMWSCMGSGAIGLPYLDKEINEQVPPRLRFYGYLNDGEFVEECAKRGITAYAVIWKAQMWEFPCELNEDESEFYTINKERKMGKRDWLGMKELSTNRYPKLFDPIEKYFPEGLYDSDGNKIEDFLEGFRVRTLDDHAVQSSWLLVPGHDHKCFIPCGNKPAYMAYIKRIAQMMIDGGARGIHLDEGDTQYFAVLSGGCFCKDCMKGFREWLKKHPNEMTAMLDLDTFDYGDYLRSLGYCDSDLVGGQAELRFDIPLFEDFFLYNVDQIRANFAELCEFCRDYSLKTKGYVVKMSSNLYNGLPRYSMMRQYSDLIAGEKTMVQLRQDGFYHYAHAFAMGKPSMFVLDPNEYMLGVVDDVDHNKHDTYKLLIMESLASGFHIAAPYGQWLMNFKKDTFYPNLEVDRELGLWLKENDRLFTNDMLAETAIIYDFRSALYTDTRLSGHKDREKGAGFRVFFDLCQDMCNHHVNYKVLYVAEEEPLTIDRLKGIKSLILADSIKMLPEEYQVIEDWAAQGGRIAGFGKLPKCMQKYRFGYQKFFQFTDWLRESGLMIEGHGNPKIGFAVQKTENGKAIHMVNYNLNAVDRIIAPIDCFSFTLNAIPSEVRVYPLPGEKATAYMNGYELVVENIGIYTIVELVD